MIRVTKGDITLECDTQAEVQLAIAVLNHGEAAALPPAGNVPTLWEAMQREVSPTLPDDSNMQYAIGVGTLGDALPPDDDDPTSYPLLKAVPILPAPQHISVSRKYREVLEAVMLFPEGVSTGSIATLLGTTDKTVGGRMQQLKQRNLVELVPGHRLWRATTLARRAKLVS